MTAKISWQHDSSPFHEAEVMALLAALSWIGDLRLQNVVIESDCIMVIDGLMQQSTNVLEFDSILDKYIQLFNSTLVD